MRIYRTFIFVAPLLLAGCGAIDMAPDDNGYSNFAALRRVFVNDAAANDSLRVSVPQGLRFVLQPGKAYGLRVEDPASGDRLVFQRFDNGRLKTLETVSARADGASEVFDLQSDVSVAAFFVGKLLPADGASAAARLRRVRLFPLSVLESARVSARLMLVGKLTGLPDAAAKAAFADSLLAQLTAIFAAWGVALSPSYALVDPAGPAVVLEFGPVFQDLPGTRQDGAAHLYLVDSIYVKGGEPGSTILGFAPREAMDLSRDKESRVVLNVRGGGANLLATTAAHELGHFFGLRHTTGTDADVAADNDASNRDDGFASTDLCLEALRKPGASERAAAAVPGYCLFIARPSCPARCDLTNLMFPFDCSRGTNAQRILTAEQQAFLRGGLGLMGAQ